MVFFHEPVLLIFKSKQALLLKQLILIHISNYYCIPKTNVLSQLYLKTGKIKKIKNKTDQIVFIWLEIGLILLT